MPKEQRKEKLWLDAMRGLEYYVYFTADEKCQRLANAITNKLGVIFI